MLNNTLIGSEKQFINLETLEELQQACRDQMAGDGFFFNESFIPSDKPIIFDGRGDGRTLEWYKADIQTDINKTLSLQVTYNSHHDDLKCDKHYSFYSKTAKPLNPFDHEATKQRVKAAKERREKEAVEKEKAIKDQAIKDRERFENASKTGESPYLGRKQIGAYNIGFERNSIEGDLVLVPFGDFEHPIKALQEIHPKPKIFSNEDKPRDKHFTNAMKGLFHVAGNLKDGEPIRASEGYATSISVYESTNCTIPHVTVGFVSNYHHVIPLLKKHYPNSPITICADNNLHNDPKKKNVGLEEARKVAGEFKCDVVFPEFPEGMEYDNADFNDLMILKGKEEVKNYFIQNEKIKEGQLKQDLENIETELLVYENDFEEALLSSESPDQAKARSMARRKVLNNEEPKKIIKDVIKQYPSLTSQAEDIVKKALEWSKSQQENCIVLVNGIPKTITSMKSLNTRFAQLEAPFQPCILINRMDTQAIATKDFDSRLSGEVIVSGVNKKGQPHYIPANLYWRGNTNKIIYRSIAFTSQPVSDDTYNLFTGFGVKPKQGKCEKIINHIEEVLCAGNKKNSEAFIKKLAWEIQNIGKPSRVVVILKSEEQQTGKGIFLGDIMLPIYGGSGFKTHDLGQIIGRFNDAIRGKAFIFLDEALFAGDFKSADALKCLSTANSTPIEQKHVSVVNAPIGINFYLTTNHPNAAHIEETDDRYWILEVSEEKKGNSEYFKELLEEVNGTGKEAFLHYLLNLDVKNFLPWRDVPKENEFKDKMKKNSINPYDARVWIEECCHARMFLGLEIKNDNTNGIKCPYDIWVPNTEYDNGLFKVAYAKWQSTVKSPIAAKPTASNNFGKLLTDLGFDLRIDGARYRKLPDPDKCLEKLEELAKKRSKK